MPMPDSQSNDGLSVIIKHRWKMVLALIIFLVTAMFFYVILPLLDGLIMGVVLAYVARPLKHAIDRYSRKASPYIATSIIVVPIFLIIGLGIIEMFNDILWAVRNQDFVVSYILDIVEKANLPDFIHDRITDIILNFASYLLPIIKQLPFADIAKASAMFLINTMLAVLLCFYLLADGGRLVDKILDIIPGEVEEFSRNFMGHFDAILSAIFIGNIYSAIAVGILSLIVFWAFGFKNALALSALMLLAAIIPLVTGWLIITPLTIQRYFEMGPTNALFFFAVAVLVIILPPELLIRPYIIHTKSDLHPMLIILAFLGGGLVGGIAGFFIAPILLGAIVAAYRAGSSIRKIELSKPNE